MVKNILFYIYLFFTVSCVRPDFQSNINTGKIETYISSPQSQEHIETEDIEDEILPCNCLVEAGDEFVGVREKGGNNQDFNNKKLKQLLVNEGWGPGQAWCSFMVKGLLNKCKVPNTITGWSPTSFNKKDIIYTDGKFKKEHYDEDVLVMSLSYNKFKNDKNRYKGIGHTGIIKEVREKNVITYEGNTSDDGGRDGDGFYKKVRPLTNNLHITRWN